MPKKISLPGGTKRTQTSTKVCGKSSRRSTSRGIGMVIQQFSWVVVLVGDLPLMKSRANSAKVSRTKRSISERFLSVENVGESKLLILKRYSRLSSGYCRSVHLRIHYTSSGSGIIN